MLAVCCARTVSQRKAGGKPPFVSVASALLERPPSHASVSRSPLARSVANPPAASPLHYEKYAMHSGQGLPNRRARRSSAQDARRGDRPCAIAHCSNTCKTALPNCQHVVCTHCVFNMMGACPGDAGPCFGFKCPICRRRYGTDLLG